MTTTIKPECHELIRQITKQCRENSRLICYFTGRFGHDWVRDAIALYLSDAARDSRIRSICRAERHWGYRCKQICDSLVKYHNHSIQQPPLMKRIQTSGIRAVYMLQTGALDSDLRECMDSFLRQAALQQLLAMVSEDRNTTLVEGVKLVCSNVNQRQDSITSCFLKLLRQVPDANGSTRFGTKEIREIVEAVRKTVLLDTVSACLDPREDILDPIHPAMKMAVTHLLEKLRVPRQEVFSYINENRRTK